MRLVKAFRESRYNLLILALFVILSTIGCGGGSAGSSEVSLLSDTELNAGAVPLSPGEIPTGDLSTEQVKNLASSNSGQPVQVWVVLDRRNPTPAAYPATVIGWSDLDGLLEVELNGPDKRFVIAVAGDSGSAVFTRSNSFPGHSQLNNKNVCTLSYGTPDNPKQFFGPPVVLVRATGTEARSGRHLALTSTQIGGKSIALRRLTTPVYSTIAPFMAKIIKPGENSAVKNAISFPAGTEPLVLGSQSRSGEAYTPDPLWHNTVVTWLARGPVVNASMTGTLSFEDGNGFVGYGHPARFAGITELASQPGRVIDIYRGTSVFSESYKRAQPVGELNMTMTYDDRNGVRFVNRAANEINVSLDYTDVNGVHHQVTHYVGHNGIAGDPSYFAAVSVIQPLMMDLGVGTDFRSTAPCTITLTVGGTSPSTKTIVVPAMEKFFTGTTADYPISTIDQIQQVTDAIEASGDLSATLTVTFSPIAR
jgi:hypothetical protein